MALTLKLPLELEDRIEKVAAQRDQPVFDLLTLLVGRFAFPRLRKSEDPVFGELSEDLMLYFQRRASGIERENNSDSGQPGKDRANQFLAWANSHNRTSPLLLDETISREAIYSRSEDGRRQ